MSATLNTAPVSLVVNVDDLGLHPAVRRAVDTLADRGIVTSSTILANGPCVAEAARTQGVGLGAHLNILRGRPLSPPSEIPSLVRDDGLFLGDYKALFLRRLRGGLNMAEVALELGRQIDRLQDMGVKLTHCDGEKHAHTLPGVMETVCAVAASRGIGWVRRPLETTCLLDLSKGGVRCKILAALCRTHRKHPDVSWPDGAFGIRDQGADLRPERLVSYMPIFRAAHPRARVLELVCHPGDSRPGDPALPQEFGPLRVDRQWRAELTALTRPEWMDIIKSLHLTLTDYGHIPTA